LIVYFIVGTLNVMGDTLLTSLPPFLPFIYLLMLSLFMARQFTDTYRKNKELSRLLLEESRIKDEFLAKTSHEFRAPLHGMMAILQAMLNHASKPALTGDQSRKVHIVMEMAKSLSRLVNDILDLAKLKRGDLKMECKEVDLFSNILVVAEVFAYMAKKEVAIQNLVPRGLPLVLADENRLRQILYNILDNAIKYTEQGRIEISAYERKDSIVVSIKDTGCGIDPDRLGTIFEPYHDYTGFSHHEMNGVGLGLNITKQLLQIQGGEIWVESEPGKGTTFHFSLPAAARMGGRKFSFEGNIDPFYLNEIMPITLPNIAGNRGGKKIIVADHDHYNLKALLESLETEGYCLIAVDEGKDVLEQLDQHSDVALILLNII
jgi:two-component system, sensor histidine kinase ChiS